MAAEPIDYEAVLADLESKRSALDTAISALRLVLAVGAQVTVGVGVSAGRPVDPASIADDAFFGLSIGEAAKKYLQMVKRKQSVKEIADALERGGLPHTSSNFANTVATMINRAAREDQELVRVGRGEWGLAAWYGNRRPKPEPQRKTKRGPRRRLPPPRQKALPAAPSSSQTSDRPTVAELAQRVLRDSGAPLHVDEIMRRIQSATGLAVKKDTMAATLSVAANKGEMFYKADPGTFGLLPE